MKNTIFIFMLNEKFLTFFIFFSLLCFPGILVNKLRNPFCYNNPVNSDTNTKRQKTEVINITSANLVEKLSLHAIFNKGEVKSCVLKLNNDFKILALGDNVIGYKVVSISSNEVVLEDIKNKAKVILRI